MLLCNARDDLSFILLQAFQVTLLVQKGVGARSHAFRPHYTPAPTPVTPLIAKRNVHTDHVWEDGRYQL